MFGISLYQKLIQSGKNVCFKSIPNADWQVKTMWNLHVMSIAKQVLVKTFLQIGLTQTDSPWRGNMLTLC